MDLSARAGLYGRSFHVDELRGGLSLVSGLFKGWGTSGHHVPAKETEAQRS